MSNEFSLTDKFLLTEFCNKIEKYDKKINYKCVDKSNNFRNEGNKHFGKDEFKEALVLFNKAIKYGPNSSEQLALGFANKSAALYHLNYYQESIDCIDLAIKNNYPEQKIKKLEERKNNCINKIKDQLDVVNSNKNEDNSEKNSIDSYNVKKKDTIKVECSDKNDLNIKNNLIVKNDLNIKNDSNVKNDLNVKNENNFKKEFNSKDGKTKVETNISENESNYSKNDIVISNNDDENNSKDISKNINFNELKVKFKDELKQDGFSENLIEIDWLDGSMKELGVRSKKNIKKGELILFEKPFVNSLNIENIDSYCYSCLKKLSPQTQYPCRQCIQVNYCCIDCEEICWNKFHNIECGYIDLYKINDHLEHHTKISSKLICSLFNDCNFNKEKFIESLRYSTKKSGRKLDKNYDSFAQLIEHENKDKNNYSLISLLLIAFFNVRFKEQSKSLFKSFFNDEELIFLKRIIEKHIRQIQVNALMITDTNVVINSEKEFPTFESNNVGIGIYINLSLINHSCKPNISISGFCDQTVLIKSNKKIEKRKWLCFSYGAHYNYQRFSKRKTLLWDSYFFDCNCECCLQKTDPIFYAILCPNCKETILSSNQKICLICSTLINREEIEKLKVETIRKINKIEKDLKDKQVTNDKLKRLINDLIECKLELQSILHPNNKCLEKIYFVLFACYKRIKNYESAYEFALLYWQCLTIKLDYYDIMSFNNMINFSNCLLKLIEEMINLNYSNKSLAFLIQEKINEMITKIKDTVEQVFDYETEKKLKVLNIFNKIKTDLELDLNCDLKFD